MKVGDTLRRFLALEWLITAAWGAALYAIGHLAKPHCRTFLWSDASISYPHAEHEAFPSWTLMPIGAAPVLVYIAHGLLVKQRLIEINLWCLIQAQSMVIMLLIVEPSKLYAGRLRPDFLDRLQRSGYGPASFADPQAYCDIAGPHHILREGRLSFPSGHSSASMAAMVPLSFYMFLALKVFSSGSIIRLFAAVTPIALAVAVAISRTVDYRHHFSDILAGSLIGLISALLALAMRFRIGSSGPARECSSCFSGDAPNAAVINSDSEQHQGRGVAVNIAERTTFMDADSIAAPHLGVRWRRSTILPFDEFTNLSRPLCGTDEPNQSGTFSAVGA